MQAPGSGVGSPLLSHELSINHHSAPPRCTQMHKGTQFKIVSQCDSHIYDYSS